MGSMGNMAGIFVILAGTFVAVVGLRGTHTAVFNSVKYGNLFANTVVTADSTAQAASNAVNPSGPTSKPGNNRGVFV